MRVNEEIERNGTKMELESLPKRRRETEEMLTQVQSWIRPLPQDVEPSKEFLRRTRLQLLKLPRQTSQASTQQAA